MLCFNIRLERCNVIRLSLHNPFCLGQDNYKYFTWWSFAIMLIYDNQGSCDLGGSINKTSDLKKTKQNKTKSLIIKTHCVYFCRVLLLTQLHWGACLVNRVLTGAQAVLQLGGGSLRRRGGTDGVGRVGWVYQRGGGSGRRGPRGAWGRRVRDFTPRLTAPTSSSPDWTRQTRAPRSTNSKWSPAEGKRNMLQKKKKHLDLETGVWLKYVNNLSEGLPWHLEQIYQHMVPKWWILMILLICLSSKTVFLSPGPEGPILCPNTNNWN